MAGKDVDAVMAAYKAVDVSCVSIGAPNSMDKVRERVLYCSLLTTYWSEST